MVYFDHCPKNTRKITGMIQWVGDRPVIVLSGGKNYSACFAFDLAHELGHLAQEGKSTINHLLERHINWDDLSNDTSDYLDRISRSVSGWGLSSKSF